MKKVILVAAVGVLALVSSSCKKDRTCSCVVTVESTLGNASFTQDTIFVDMKKSEAEDKCTGLDASYSSGGESITSVCELK